MSESSSPALLNRRNVIAGGVTLFVMAGCKPKVSSNRSSATQAFYSLSASTGDLEFSPPTDDDFWSYEDPIANIKYISASDLKLTKDFINPLRDLVINADTIEVADTIVLPSRRITIFARKLSFGDGGSLDCSGPTGAPDYSESEHGTDGSNIGYGSNGADGAAGGPGGNGGEIRLLASELSGKVAIRNVGGNGGRPQNGGQGASGAPGAYGARIGDRGGNGGNGGNGGLAGRPGDGGKGGLINIAADKAPDPSQWALDQSAGKPGRTALHGGPGGPGPRGGGHSGDVRECD